MSIMPTTFKLNADGARKADAPPRINATGAYQGRLTRVELVTSDEGTVGLDMSFAADDGGRADYLTLWLSKRDGTELRGRRVLDAMMACMSLREIEVQPGKVRRWDAEKRAEYMEDAQIVPALMNKPIGLVLQREEYYGRNGKRDRMNLFTAFQHGTRLMAKEILDRQVQPKALDLLLPTVKDKLAAPGSGSSPRTPQGGGGNSAGHGGGFDEMDDDIPF